MFFLSEMSKRDSPRSLGATSLQGEVLARVLSVVVSYRDEHVCVCALCVVLSYVGLIASEPLMSLLWGHPPTWLDCP